MRCRFTKSVKVVQDVSLLRLRDLSDSDWDGQGPGWAGTGTGTGNSESGQGPNRVTRTVGVGS